MIANIFKTAVYHHSKKNFLKAKEIYETLLQTNPKNINILQLVIFIFINQMYTNATNNVPYTK